MLVNRTYYRPPPSSASCQLCQDLRIRSEEEDFGSLGMPLWQMEASAQRGCFICGILREAVTELTEDFVIPSDLPGREIIGFNIRSEAFADEAAQNKRLPTPLSLVLKTEYSDVAELEVFCLEDEPATKWPLIGPARDVCRDASEGRCVALAMSWITDCVENHADCQRSTDPIMPDRLVYVGKDVVAPCLYLNNPAAHGKYAALSHCWGGKVSQSLESGTLEDFVQRIPDPALPLTFQHAVEACRSLGIDFLWIDSLCIVQDVSGDWLTQSAKMYEYYSNSWVTIAADGAADSTTGFLRDPRRISNVKCFDCPVDRDGEPFARIFVRWKGVGGVLDTFSHHVWKGPLQSALSYRGWTLQESLLAPRILHYTAEEVVFECQVESRCECQVRAHKFSATVPAKMAMQNRTGDFNGKWAMIVDHYSSRDLTDQTDKLIAISGLARSLKSQTSSSYWAGLWSSDYPGALLWMTYDYNGFERPQASKRISQYQAPTWSWASVSGRVILHRSGIAEIPNVEVVDVSLKSLGEDPYGALEHASITVRGFLAPVTVTATGRQRAQNMFQIITRTNVKEQQLDGAIFPDVHGTEDEIVPDSPYWILPVCGASGILVSKDERLSNLYKRVARVDVQNVEYLKFITMATWKEIQMI